MFLLFLVYLAFIIVLSMLGIDLPLLVVIVFLMAFLNFSRTASCSGLRGHGL